MRQYCQGVHEEFSMVESDWAAKERKYPTPYVHPELLSYTFVKVTIAGGRPSRLGRDVVTFEDMREFLVAYLEYEQQMHVANEDGGDRVLARRRELVDSATQMVVADEFYDGKPWIDLSEQELNKERARKV